MASETRMVARDMFGTENACYIDAIYDDNVTLAQGPQTSECSKNDGFIRRLSEFRQLAALDGDSTSLSQTDLSILRDPKILADFIEKHPGFDEIVDFYSSDAVLQMGKRNAGKVGGVDHRRLVYYIQLALNNILPDEFMIKNVNGSYNQETARSVKKFQELAGVEDDRNGTVIGKVTLSRLVFHLKYSKIDMINALSNTEYMLTSEDSKNYLRLDQECPPNNTMCTDVHAVVVDAMRWLGWFGTHIDDRNIAQSILDKKYQDNGIRIGPIIVNWLISKINESPLK